MSVPDDVLAAVEKAALEVHREELLAAVPEADPLAAAHEEIAQLQMAVQSNRVIGQATGILIERFRLTPEAAFTALARVSQNTNTKVVDIARELVETGTTEGLDPSLGSPTAP